LFTSEGWPRWVRAKLGVRTADDAVARALNESL
jgi:hypothetical protein